MLNKELRQSGYKIALESAQYTSHTIAKRLRESGKLTDEEIEDITGLDKAAIETYASQQMETEDKIKQAVESERHKTAEVLLKNRIEDKIIIKATGLNHNQLEGVKYRSSKKAT